MELVGVPNKFHHQHIRKDKTILLDQFTKLEAKAEYPVFM